MCSLEFGREKDDPQRNADAEKRADGLHPLRRRRAGADHAPRLGRRPADGEGHGAAHGAAVPQVCEAIHGLCLQPPGAAGGGDDHPGHGGGAGTGHGSPRNRSGGHPGRVHGRHDRPVAGHRPPPSGGEADPDGDLRGAEPGSPGEHPGVGRSGEGGRPCGIHGQQPAAHLLGAVLPPE